MREQRKEIRQERKSREDGRIRKRFSTQFRRIQNTSSKVYQNVGRIQKFERCLLEDKVRVKCMQE